MSVADDYRAIVGRLRSWGFAINETSGGYGRSNGLGWGRGVPVGHVNHHFVCSLNPSQSYINGLVNGLMNGKTVNWFADVNGRGYLVGTGPMNHAGKGLSSVLARTTNRQAPVGPAEAAGDMTGNTFYSGTELQHPGDSTPYPQPMVDLMVAISAAEAMQWGWSPNQVIDHYEWTGRKIDMSLWGGRSSGATAGNRMRLAAAARMGDGKAVGTAPDKPAAPEPPEGDWFDMATAADLDAAIKRAIPDIAQAVWGHYYPVGDAPEPRASMADFVKSTLVEQRRQPVDTARAVWDTVVGTRGSAGNVLAADYEEAIDARPKA